MKIEGRRAAPSVPYLYVLTSLIFFNSAPSRNVVT
jgi:hypothetical protein